MGDALILLKVMVKEDAIQKDQYKHQHTLYKKPILSVMEYLLLKKLIINLICNFQDDEKPKTPYND